MKGTLLLNYDENTRKIEEEEKYKFLRALLSQMGVPIEDFWTSDEPLTINQKIKLREILSSFSIQVIDDLSNHMQVYVDNELAGEFFPSLFKIKKDLRERDPRKQLYIEMTIEYTSVFEEAEQ